MGNSNTFSQTTAGSNHTGGQRHTPNSKDSLQRGYIQEKSPEGALRSTIKSNVSSKSQQNSHNNSNNMQGDGTNMARSFNYNNRQPSNETKITKHKKSHGRSQKTH
mmetsp:Transcript_28515/g.27487  ORF Transcript_28515/g.27487 Transcript_28515/m.27487 type:complete len:106 (+) Transcript_28515:370-687(+)